MADYAMVICWGTGYPGRENLGLEVFNTALQYFEGLKQKGEVERVGVYINDTGDLTDWTGTLVVEGEQNQIQAMLNSEDCRAILSKGAHVAQNFRIRHGATGERVQERVQELTKWRKELGL